MHSSHGEERLDEPLLLQAGDHGSEGRVLLGRGLIQIRTHLEEVGLRHRKRCHRRHRERGLRTGTRRGPSIGGVLSEIG